MTVTEFRKMFWFIAPSIPCVNEGEVPLLLYNGKAYVPGPNNQCVEYPNEQAVKNEYPGGKYIIVGCTTLSQTTIRLAKIEAEMAAKYRLEEIERKRVADNDHRDKIEQGIFDQLADIIGNEISADEVLTALRNGKIDHVTILY